MEIEMDRVGESRARTKKGGHAPAHAETHARTRAYTGSPLDPSSAFLAPALLSLSPRPPHPTAPPLLASYAKSAPHTHTPFIRPAFLRTHKHESTPIFPIPLLPPLMANSFHTCSSPVQHTSTSSISSGESVRYLKRAGVESSTVPLNDDEEEDAAEEEEEGEDPVPCAEGPLSNASLDS